MKVVLEEVLMTVVVVFSNQVTTHGNRICCQHYIHSFLSITAHKIKLLFIDVNIVK